MTNFCSFCIFTLILDREKLHLKMFFNLLGTNLTCKTTFITYILLFFSRKSIKKKKKHCLCPGYDKGIRKRYYQVTSFLGFFNCFLECFSFPSLISAFALYKYFLTNTLWLQEEESGRHSFSLVSSFCILLAEKILVGYNAARKSLDLFAVSLRKGSRF